MPRGRKMVRVHRAGLAFLVMAAPLALALASMPLPAWGQGAAKPGAASRDPAARDSGARHDPANITALSEVAELCGKGNERYAARDFSGAVELYRRAIQLGPRDPLGHYLLGEGLLATSNLSEAEASFVAAVERSDVNTAPVLRAHALFAVADCYEREKKWEAARGAWQAYTEHAAKLGPEAGGHPQSGASRLKVIDDWLLLDKQYEVVRQRLAAERADAGADSGKAAGGAGKK